MLDPRTFPRPPALEPVFNKLIQIRWRKSGALIAESRKAWWVLETYHPPSEFCFSEPCCAGVVEMCFVP